MYKGRFVWRRRATAPASWRLPLFARIDDERSRWDYTVVIGSNGQEFDTPLNSVTFSKVYKLRPLAYVE